MKISKSTAIAKANAIAPKASKIVDTPVGSMTVTVCVVTV
jgi:hypothetical protein